MSSVEVDALARRTACAVQVRSLGVYSTRDARARHNAKAKARKLSCFPCYRDPCTD